MTLLRIILSTTMAVAGGLAHADAPPIRDFVLPALFDQAVLSPDGTYLALLVPEQDMTFLSVFRVADKSPVSRWDFGSGHHVRRVTWVTEERFLVEVAPLVGRLDQVDVLRTSYLGNADGSRRQSLGNGPLFKLIDVMKEDPGHILMMDVLSPRLVRMSILDGSTRVHATLPRGTHSAILDRDLRPRFVTVRSEAAQASSFQRDGDAGWAPMTVHGQSPDGSRVPERLDRNDRLLYMYATDAGGPRRLVRYDPANGTMEELHRHPHVQMGELLVAADGSDAYGVSYLPGRPRHHVFDPDHPEARLLRAIEAAFPDHHVSIESRTWDGRLVLVLAASDVDPGSLYLVDTSSLQASFLLARRPWIDPQRMAPMRPITMTARDSTVLHGYLTLPRQAEGKRLPLVVRPHGDPLAGRDVWTFHDEVQLLASRGYAVLQINYRGSAGYGYAFLRHGFQALGQTMQDDITDATRWAINEGIVDPERICIYGASFGGYSALMGVVREPELYRCAIGYAGIYSLPLLRSRGTSQSMHYFKRFLAIIAGSRRNELRERSPANHAERIQVPVLLAHGRRDQRASIHQFDAMQRALAAARKPHKTFVVDEEGHGYFAVSSRADFYERMLAFLADNIGAGAEHSVESANP
ncbi:MAG TPA: prolyl oligopeptidase family serine peptidase [Xanthomonadaceae bacterium]|nr:prolyl oligopeptidase family serine peptidase [Xanthomonadaceae bacterium]